MRNVTPGNSMGWSLEPLQVDDEPFWRDWRGITAGQELQHPCLDANYVRAAVAHFSPPAGRLWKGRYDAAGGSGAAVLERRGHGSWSTWHVPVLSIAPMVFMGSTAATSAAPLARLCEALPGPAWNVRLYDCDPRYQLRIVAQEHGSLVHLPLHVTLSIDTVSDFDHYWSHRPRRLRSRLSAALRKAHGAGDLQLRLLDDAAAMPAAVADHARLEASGWKGANGSAMRVDDAYGRFYADVLQAFAAGSHARVYQLMLDDRVVASQLCLLTGGTLVTMKTTYLDEAAPISPGRVLDYLMLEQLFADTAVERVEYIIHASANDLAWATSYREMQQLDALRPAALAGALRAKRRLFRRAPPPGASAADAAGAISAP